jgi:hypothetical protein
MRNRIRNLLKTISCYNLSLATVIGLITIVAFGGSGCAKEINWRRPSSYRNRYFVDGLLGF